MIDRNSKGKFIKGYEAWNKGKPLSIEHKKRIGQSNKGNLKIKIPRERLKKLYLEEKLTIDKIATMLNISSSTILARMNECGIERRSRSEANMGKTISKETREKQSKIFKGRHFSLSTEFKKGHPCYSKITREMIDKASEAKRKFYLSKDELNQLYKVKKLSSNEIAKKFNVTGPTVRNWLKRYEIPVRTYSKASQLLWKRPKFVKRMMEKLHVKPNKPESKLIRLIDDNNLPFDYVGDGSALIGGLCPDFLHNEERKIIEIFGRIYHDPSISFKKINWKRQYWGRKAIFSQLGYDTLIIWDDELGNEHKIIERIRGFMND